MAQPARRSSAPGCDDRMRPSSSRERSRANQPLTDHGPPHGKPDETICEIRPSDPETGGSARRTHRKDQSMTIKLFAPAAVTGLLLTAIAVPVTAAAQTAAQHEALASDSAFIQTAGSLALLQVKLGKLAQEQGSSEAVRDFGKRMVADYTKASEQLAAGAKQAAYPKPVLLRPHQKVFERFNFMSKSDFDKKYMAEMVGQHDEAVRLFEQEAKHARVQSLRHLAASLLPDVQQDQSVAIQAAGSVGADVTATASREQ